MPIKRQQQQAGAGSNQYQVEGPLVVIDKAAASEIANALGAMVAAQEFTAQASETADERINRFDEKIIGEFSEKDLLKTFADPQFQILLRKTQLHAASTGEDSDHDLLTKLLAERAQEPSRPMHSVVTRAVEVVEHIDPAALRGMTFLWFAGTIGPHSPDPKAGLLAIDGLVAKLADGDLPTGTAWLQRLDMLNCIHYTPPGFQTMMKWHEIVLSSRPGYACEGIQAADVATVRFRLMSVAPNLGPLVVKHPFLSGCYRIDARSSTQLIETLTPGLQQLRQARDQIPRAALNPLGDPPPLEKLGSIEELQAVLTEVRMDTVNAKAKANFIEFIESELPNLQTMRSWWDGLPGAITLVPVGIAVAYSNAKRYDELGGLGSLSDMIGD